MPVYLRELTVAQLETTRAYHGQRIAKARSERVKASNRKRIAAIDRELAKRTHVATEKGRTP